MCAYANWSIWSHTYVCAVSCTPGEVVKSVSLAFWDLIKESDTIIGVNVTSQLYLQRKSSKSRSDVQWRIRNIVTIDSLSRVVWRCRPNSRAAIFGDWRPAARLFQRLEFGNLVLRMRSKMSSYVNCAQFCEGFFHSMDAIFQLFSYFPCKLDVLVLVVIFKKEYQEVF